MIPYNIRRRASDATHWCLGKRAHTERSHSRQAITRTSYHRRCTRGPLPSRTTRRRPPPRSHRSSSPCRGQQRSSRYHHAGPTKSDSMSCCWENRHHLYCRQRWRAHLLAHEWIRASGGYSLSRFKCLTNTCGTLFGIDTSLRSSRLGTTTAQTENGVVSESNSACDQTYHGRRHYCCLRSGRAPTRPR